jgi:hypothetical protein
MAKTTNPEVLAFLRENGKRGGDARARNMSAEDRLASAMTANAARHKKLGKKKRREIARHAANVRWGKA